ncbi:alpha/beta hydrolase, partial [Daejeonella sp.]|uniref:alpha/beta hydrolase n=1 Tax=Daejeonella sp. TaxID=2805397 RepID=UPI0030BAA867
MKSTGYRNTFAIAACLLLLYAFKATEIVPQNLKAQITDTLKLNRSAPPFVLENSKFSFFKNLSYGKEKEQVFDIFLPNAGKPSGLVIYVFGGGFIRGNQAQPYPNSKALINKLLANNIAYASVNYRYVSDDGKGLFKCFNDVARGLQYIRMHFRKLNIEKQNVVFMGGSAGAGASIWIALSNDMADKNNPDPVLRESTRVKGVVAMETQATYDILNWHNHVYNEYLGKGMSQKFILDIGTPERILTAYGFKSFADTATAAGIARRKSLNLLNLMSKDDPEIFAENVKRPYR